MGHQEKARAAARRLEFGVATPLAVADVATVLERAAVLAGPSGTGGSFHELNRRDGDGGFECTYGYIGSERLVKVMDLVFTCATIKPARRLTLEIRAFNYQKRSFGRVSIDGCEKVDRLQRVIRELLSLKESGEGAVTEP